MVSFDAIQPQLPDKFVLFQSGGKCQEINGRIASEGYIEFAFFFSYFFLDYRTNQN